MNYSLINVVFGGDILVMWCMTGVLGGDILFMWCTTGGGVDFIIWTFSGVLQGDLIFFTGGLTIFFGGRYFDYVVYDSGFERGYFVYVVYHKVRGRFYYRGVQ